MDFVIFPWHCFFWSNPKSFMRKEKRTRIAVYNNSLVLGWMLWPCWLFLLHLIMGKRLPINSLSLSLFVLSCLSPSPTEDWRGKTAKAGACWRLLSFAPLSFRFFFMYVLSQKWALFSGLSCLRKQYLTLSIRTFCSRLGLKSLMFR